MKRLTLILAIATLGATLTACGPKPTEPAAKPAPPAPAANGMDMKADMPGMTMANGTGTVTAIDKAAGTITLDHGPIAAAGWPAMTMEFKATPATLLDTVKVGDKVSFQLKMIGGTGEVTSITVQ